MANQERPTEERSVMDGNPLARLLGMLIVVIVVTFPLNSWSNNATITVSETHDTDGRYTVSRGRANAHYTAGPTLYESFNGGAWRAVGGLPKLSSSITFA